MSKPCKYCQLAIFWSQEDDRWVPYEDEARTKIHDCPKKSTAVPEVGKPKPVKVTPSTDEEILFLRQFRHWCKDLAP
jgi:hypothetical protein